MTIGRREIKKIKKLRELGFSIREIAKKTNRDKNTVNKYVKTTQERHSLIDNLTGYKKLPRIKTNNPSFDLSTGEPYKTFQPIFRNNYGESRFFEFNQPNVEQVNQQVIYEKQVEEERLERERKQKYFEDMDAEIKSLKRKLKEKKAREANQFMMNQLQSDMDKLKIAQKHTRDLSEARKKNLQASINNNIVKKEKAPVVLKPVSVQEDSRKKEEIHSNEDKPELIQNPKVSTVLKPVEQISQELNEEDEDIIEIPDWSIYMTIIGSLKLVKRYFVFLNSPDSKLPKNSLEYRIKLIEYLLRNN